MANTDNIRRINNQGFVLIPQKIYRDMGLKDGDVLEFIPNYNNKEIVIRPYKKSFEQCAIDWYHNHSVELNKCDFFTEESYTFCITHFPYTPSRAGFAKRNAKDKWDFRIGKVAAYANAMGRNLNKMIGYEG